MSRPPRPESTPGMEESGSFVQDPSTPFGGSTLITELPRVGSAAVPQSPMHPASAGDIQELVRIATANSRRTPGTGGSVGLSSALGARGSAQLPPSEQMLRRFESIVAPMEVVDVGGGLDDGFGDRQELLKSLEAKDYILVSLMKKDMVKSVKARKLIENAHRRFVTEHELAMKRKEEIHELEMHIALMDRRALTDARHEAVMLSKESAETRPDGTVRSTHERKLHRAIQTLLRDNELLARTNEQLRNRVTEMGEDMSKMRKSLGDNLTKIFNEAFGARSEMMVVGQMVNRYAEAQRRALQQAKAAVQAFVPQATLEVRTAMKSVQKFMVDTEQRIMKTAGKELKLEERERLDELEEKCNSIYKFLNGHIGMFSRARGVAKLLREMRGIGAPLGVATTLKPIHLRATNFQAMLRIFSSLHEALKLALGPDRAQEAGVDFPIEEDAPDLGTIDQSIRLMDDEPEFILNEHLRAHIAALEAELVTVKQGLAEHETHAASGESHSMLQSQVISLRAQVDSMKHQLMETQVKLETMQKARFGNFLIQSTLRRGSHTHSTNNLTTEKAAKKGLHPLFAKQLMEVEESESIGRMDIELDSSYQYTQMLNEALEGHNRNLRKMLFLDKWRANTGQALDAGLLSSAMSEMLDRQARLDDVERETRHVLQNKVRVGTGNLDEDLITKDDNSKIGKGVVKVLTDGKDLASFVHNYEGMPRSATPQAGRSTTPQPTKGKGKKGKGKAKAEPAHDDEEARGAIVSLKRENKILKAQCAALDKQIYNLKHGAEGNRVEKETLTEHVNIVDPAAMSERETMTDSVSQRHRSSQTMNDLMDELHDLQMAKELLIQDNEEMRAKFADETATLREELSKFEAKPETAEKEVQKVDEDVEAVIQEHKNQVEGVTQRMLQMAQEDHEEELKDLRETVVSLKSEKTLLSQQLEDAHSMRRSSLGSQRTPAPQLLNIDDLTMDVSLVTPDDGNISPSSTMRASNRKKSVKAGSKRRMTGKSPMNRGLSSSRRSSTREVVLLEAEDETRSGTRTPNSEEPLDVPVSVEADPLEAPSEAVSDHTETPRSEQPFTEIDEVSELERLRQQVDQLTVLLQAEKEDAERRVLEARRGGIEVFSVRCQTDRVTTTAADSQTDTDRLEESDFAMLVKSHSESIGQDTSDVDGLVGEVSSLRRALADSEEKLRRALFDHAEALQEAAALRDEQKKGIELARLRAKAESEAAQALAEAKKRRVKYATLDASDSQAYSSDDDERENPLGDADLLSTDARDINAELNARLKQRRKVSKLMLPAVVQTDISAAELMEAALAGGPAEVHSRFVGTLTLEIMGSVPGWEWSKEAESSGSTTGEGLPRRGSMSASGASILNASTRDTAEGGASSPTAAAPAGTRNVVRSAMLKVVDEGEIGIQAAPEMSDCDVLAVQPVVNASIMTDPMVEQELIGDDEADLHYKYETVRSKVHELEAKVAMQVHEIETKERRVFEANLRVRELEIELEENRVSFRDSESTMRRRSIKLEESLSETVMAREAEKKSLTATTARLREAEARAQDLKAELDEWKEKFLQKEASSRSQAQHSLDDSEMIMELKEKVHTLRHANQALAEERDLLKSASTNPIALMEAAEAATKRANDAEATIDTLKEQLEASETSLHTVKRDAARREESLEEALTAAKDRLKSEQERSRRTIEGHIATIGSKDKEIASANKALKASMKVTDERDAQIRLLRDDGQQLRSVIAAMEKSASETQLEHNNLTQELYTQIEDQQNAAADANRRFHETLDTLTRENVSLKAVLEEAQKQLVTAEAEAAKGGGVVDLLEAELKHSREELKTAKVDMALAKRETERALALVKKGPKGGIPEIKDSERALIEAEAELEAVKDEAATAAQAFNTAHAALSDKLSVASKERDKLRGQLHRAEGNLKGVDQSLMNRYGFMSRADLISALGYQPTSHVPLVGSASVSVKLPPSSPTVKSTPSLLSSPTPKEASAIIPAAIATPTPPKDEVEVVAGEEQRQPPESEAAVDDGIPRPTSGGGLSINSESGVVPASDPAQVAADRQELEGLRQEVAALRSRIVELMAQSSAAAAEVQRLKDESDGGSIDDIIATILKRVGSSYGAEKSKWSDVYNALSIARRDIRVVPTDGVEGLPLRAAEWINENFGGVGRRRLMLQEAETPLSEPCADANLESVVLGKAETTKRHAQFTVPVFSGIHGFAFDAGAARGITILPQITAACILSYRCVKESGVSIPHIVAFVEAVSKLYNERNQYSCSVHGIIAVHTTHTILARSPVGKFGPSEIIAALVGSAALGAVSPAAPAAFLAEEKASLSRLFGEVAPQQRAAAALIQSLFRTESCDFTRSMGTAAGEATRRLLEQILGDAVCPFRQKAVVARINEVNASFAYNTTPNDAEEDPPQEQQQGIELSPEQSAEHRAFLIGGIVRFADVCRMHSRPAKGYLRHLELFTQELWAVGDMQRGRALDRGEVPEIHPVHDREVPQAVREVQVAMYTHVVKPLVDALRIHLPHTLVDRTEANGRYWFAHDEPQSTAITTRWAQLSSTIEPWHEREVGPLMRTLANAGTRLKKVDRGIQTQRPLMQLSELLEESTATRAMLQGSHAKTPEPTRAKSLHHLDLGADTEKRDVSPPRRQSAIELERELTRNTQVDAMKRLLQNREQVVGALATQCTTLQHKVTTLKERQDFLEKGVKSVPAPGTRSGSPTAFEKFLTAKKPRWVTEKPEASPRKGHHHGGAEPQLPPWAGPEHGGADPPEKAAKELAPLRAPLANPPPGRKTIAGPVQQRLPVGSRLRGVNTLKQNDNRKRNKWQEAFGVNSREDPWKQRVDSSSGDDDE